MAYTPYTWHDGASGGTPLTAARLNVIEQGISNAAAVADSIDNRPYVIPEDYVQSGDNGNWALAIGRALAAAIPLNASVLLGQMYACSSTITLNTRASLVGFGQRTGIQAPTNTPMVLLSGTSVSDIHLDNFTVDGNCLASQTKSFARSVRLVGCSKIRYYNMYTRYTPDWGTSFEQCTEVYVRSYTHEAGNTSGAAGAALAGRDGIHFLDCNDFLLDGARIHSRDDCIGITSQTGNISRGTIRNVTGISQVAAVVTLGNESTSAFTALDMVVDNISSYQSLNYTGVTNYLVKLLAQNSSVASHIRVSNVSGVAKSYGVYLNNLSQVEISNVDATSTTQHGVYLLDLDHFSASNVQGTSQAGAFDGVNLTGCSYGNIQGGGAQNAALWGLQINGGSNLQVWGFNSLDNGSVNFSTNNGGNLRVVNTTGNVKIYGGQYVGGTSTSYFGSSTSANTSLDLTTIPPVIGGAH